MSSSLLASKKNGFSEPQGKAKQERVAALRIVRRKRTSPYLRVSHKVMSKMGVDEERVDRYFRGEGKDCEGREQRRPKGGYNHELRPVHQV